MDSVYLMSTFFKLRSANSLTGVLVAWARDATLGVRLLPRHVGNVDPGHFREAAP